MENIARVMLNVKFVRYARDKLCCFRGRTHFRFRNETSIGRRQLLHGFKMRTFFT